MKEDKKGKGIKVEIMKPFLRSEGAFEIFRKTEEDGRVTYIESGEIEREIETVDQELELSIGCILERFEALSELIVQENSTLAFLIQAIVKQAKIEVEEMFEFIYEDIGNISCTWTKTRYCGNRSRCVGAFFEPPKRKREKIYNDTDPEILDLLKQIPLNRTTPVKLILKQLKNGKDFMWYPTEKTGPQEG